MKRGALVALLALLALLVVSSMTTAAIAGAPAQASKKGKKKGCKKKGKAKSRASAAASAKKKGCKAKGKTKGKAPQGGSNGQGTKTPAGASPQPAAPGVVWPPVDGVYADGGNQVELKIEGNGSSALVRASNAAFCSFSINTSPKPTTTTATTLTAGGEEKVTPIAGESGTVKWGISVASNLSYTLTVDTSLEGELLPACDKPGTIVKGTLSKIG